MDQVGPDQASELILNIERDRTELAVGNRIIGKRCDIFDPRMVPVPHLGSEGHKRRCVIIRRARGHPSSNDSDCQRAGNKPGAAERPNRIISVTRGFSVLKLAPISAQPAGLISYSTKGWPPSTPSHTAYFPSIVDAATNRFPIPSRLCPPNWQALRASHPRAPSGISATA